jgi:2-polyprenyl-3-methyl-5-hydroxy-6-metoxy-1,4-benzoquinol methylase
MDPRVEVVVVYNEPDTLENVFLRSSGLARACVSLIDNTALGRSLPEIFNEHKSGSSADWLVFCHQDFVVFDADWIERITRLPQEACYGPIGVDGSGRFIGRITQADGTYIGLPVDGADVVTLDEQCLIVPRPIYSAADFDGRFAFDLYAHDYCVTATRAGFHVKTFQMNCQHRSKSVTEERTRRSYFDAKRTYIWKHRDMAPLFTTTFQWRPKYWSVPDESGTLQAELALIPDGSRVLEVGPAAGHVTQELKRKGCEVTGLELDPALAGMARSLYRRMVVGNIEDLDLDAELPEDFDVILCGDVLEHLANPEAVLQKLKRRLALTGYLVVSLPNVAHGSVRLSLLEGRFTYVKEGLLDVTHLRFFTLDSIREVFNRNGFEIQDLHRTRVRLFETEIPLKPSQIAGSTIRRLLQDPEATTYQFVFRAVPSCRPNDLADLRDATFDPARERQLFATYCLQRAWLAFHDQVPDSIAARAWARLLLCTGPSFKAAFYWIVSLLPLQMVSLLVSWRSGRVHLLP